VLTLFENNILQHLTDIGATIARSSKTVIKEAASVFMENYKATWCNRLHNDIRKNPQSRNKLRSYRSYKHEYSAEAYLTSHLNKRHRRAFALFRTGVAPLAIETGRYSKGAYIPAQDRLCELCDLKVPETECHVLTTCALYNDIREELYHTTQEHVTCFNGFNLEDKFYCLMSDKRLFKYSAKACYDILLRRNDYIYNNAIT
jgi:hypothetical protein